MIFNLNKLWKTNRRASVRATLDLVVRELNKGDEASSELWDILSALRGPDASGCAGIKYGTTARLRAIIGLEHQDYANTDNGPIEDLTDRDVQRAGAHFAQHIDNAKYALAYLGYIKSRDQLVDDAIATLNKL